MAPTLVRISFSFENHRVFPTDPPVNFSKTGLLPRRHRMLRADGFTLFEILVVVGIIGLLATFVVTNFSQIFGGAKEDLARTFVNSGLDHVLLKFRMDTGSYPTTQEGIQALYTAPPSRAAKWRGPYIKRIPEDPWGIPYQYRYPGTKNPDEYDLFSYGPDKVESADDIGNWE